MNPEHKAVVVQVWYPGPQDEHRPVRNADSNMGHSSPNGSESLEMGTAIQVPHAVL